MAGTSTPKATLLVVDDDASTREGLREFLSASGFAVELAVDGIDGLSAFERCRPDLVIVDLEMPRLDGRGLIAAIRERAPKTTILALTARMAVDAEREAQRLGVQAYVNKPVDLDILLGRISALL